MRSVKAYYPIIWRDVKIAFCNVNSLISNFIVPSMLLALFAVGMSSSFSMLNYHGSQISYFNFFFPGLLGMQIVFIMTSTVNSVVLDTDRQISAIISFSKVSMFHYYGGKYIASVIIIIARVVFLYIVALTFFGFQLVFQVKNMVLIGLALIFGVLIFFNFGFIIGSLFKVNSIRDLFITLVPPLMIFTSNSYYSMDGSPAFLRLIGMFNPLVYIVKLLRNAILLLELPSSWWHDLSILLMISIASTAIAISTKGRLVYKM